MTSHALLSRWLPVLYLAFLVLLAAAMSFNGLCGPDMHACLQLFRGLYAPTSPGMLQGISILSATLCCLVFERLLYVLSHGSRAESRWIFTGLSVAIAPMFLHAGLTVSTDAFGLLLSLTSFYFGLKALEKKHTHLMPMAILFGSAAVVSHSLLAALLAPFLLWLVWYAWQKKRRGALLWSLVAMVPAALFLVWVKQVPGPTWWQTWSALHFFQKSFTDNGQVLSHTLPNLLYVFFPLAHPVFLLHLPLLLLLAKKTDVVLSEKRVLLTCTFIYLALLGGLPFQQVRYLLPVYLIWLLVLFPSWDRMYCYGLIFFRKITLGVIGFTLAVQLACGIRMFRPVVECNQLETGVAKALKDILPVGAVLYTTNLEPAMRSYLPHLRVVHLSASSTAPEAGAYLLYESGAPEKHPGFRALQEQTRLVQLAQFAKEWTLWEVR